MPDDFVRAAPSPKYLTTPPTPPAVPPPPAVLPAGLVAYWVQLHGYTTYSSGMEPPGYALALARAAGLHFYAVTDLVTALNPARWARLLDQTRASTAPGQFVALS